MSGTERRAAGAEPVSILVGALGGEGGGVLTDWLVAAATARDFTVQSTSIPGVAQRTGATTYYTEILPVPRAELGGRRPVLGLYPAPGGVDLAVMSELVEAGRAIESGFVTPERTVLVASTHRIFAIAEKSAMGDGRIDAERIRRAAEEMARRPLLFDLAEAARASGSVINAVLLGAIAGSGVLPFTPQEYEQAISAKGVAVEANLRGFAAGLALSRGGPPAAPAAAAQPSGPSAPPLPAALRARVEGAFPAETRETVTAGVRRLLDYQGPRYAALFLERLERVLALDEGSAGHALTRETARHLALWMSYEDAIRVADLKTRAGRMARVRAEAGARPSEPVRIADYLDPGLDEICAVLPPWLARPLWRLAERHPALARFRRPMAVRTDSVAGFFQLWLMARLRFWRPYSWRYGEEQALIARWLEGVMTAARQDPALALEVVACARLVKGYGDTHQRGGKNFLRIFHTLLEPAIQAGGGPLPSAGRVRAAREAALADPEGQALSRALADAGGALPTGSAGGPAAPLPESAAGG